MMKIIRRIHNTLRFNKEEYYNNLFPNFRNLFEDKMGGKYFNIEFVDFIDITPTKDLALLHLKCKDITSSDRVIQFLNNEINRRLQNRTIIIQVVDLINFVKIYQ